MISLDHTIFLEPQLFMVCRDISKREQKDYIATVNPIAILNLLPRNLQRIVL